MPSPFAHALAGLATGWAVYPLVIEEAAPSAAAGSSATLSDRLRRQVSRWRWPLAFAAVSLLPDLDLLVHRHSQQTHSLGAAAIVFAASLALLWRREPQPVRLAAALSLGYASHVLLDWLGSDTTPPLGIMALWPASSGYYLSPFHLFMGISRRYWLAAAWRQDIEALGREVVFMVPVAAAVLYLRRLEVRRWVAGSTQQPRGGDGAGRQSVQSEGRSGAGGESSEPD
jgi:membrane-bound metal-dependent hydrolase YbcI (DUF457 family)